MFRQKLREEIGTGLGKEEKLMLVMQRVWLEYRRSRSAKFMELIIALLAHIPNPSSFFFTPCTRVDIRQINFDQHVSRMSKVDDLFPSHQLRRYRKLYEPWSWRFSVKIISMYHGCCGGSVWGRTSDSYGCGGNSRVVCGIGINDYRFASDHSSFAKWKPWVGGRSYDWLGLFVSYGGEIWSGYFPNWSGKIKWRWEFIYGGKYCNCFHNIDRFF